MKPAKDSRSGYEFRRVPGFKSGLPFGAGMSLILFFASMVELGDMTQSVFIGLGGGVLSGLLFGGMMHWVSKRI